MEIVNFEMPEFGNPRISGAGATRSPLSVFAGQTPAAIFPKMGAWLGTKKADQGSAIVSAAAPRKLQGVRGLRWPREYALKGMRGASWNNDATNLRVSDRNNAGWTNTNRNNNVGFRPASTPAVSVAAERSFAKRMGQSWRFAATGQPLQWQSYALRLPRAKQALRLQRRIAMRRLQRRMKKYSHGLRTPHGRTHII